MGVRQFSFTELLMKSLLTYGDQRVSDYIQSQMLVHGFDRNKPHRLEHDAVKHCYVVMQEVDDQEEVEVPDEDEETAFQRRGERAISWNSPDDLSI